MVPWRFPLLKIAFLVVTLSFLTTACSDDDNPAQPAAPVDFVGTWSVSEMASLPGTPPDTLDTYDMVITQVDSLFDVQIEGDMFSGTVADRTLTVSNGSLAIPFCLEEDRILKSATFTMDASGDALSGNSEWCCPAGFLLCPEIGTSTLTATRLQI